MGAVFPPDLIMKHARAIGLRPEQKKLVTRAVGETQTKALELQWEMQEKAQQLSELMTSPRIDEKAALAAAGRIFELEGQVKRAHLRLLIRIKNALEPDQQAALQRLRDAG